MEHKLSDIDQNNFTGEYSAHCESCYDPDYEDGQFTGFHDYSGSKLDILNEHLDHVNEMEEEQYVYG